MAPSYEILLLILSVLGIVMFAGGMTIYGWVIRNITIAGGKVSASKFGPADLLVAGLILSWFLANILTGFESKPRPVHMADVIAGLVFYTGFVALIVSILRFRHLDLRELFGFGKVRPGKALGLAVVLLLSAYPAVSLVSAITQLKLGKDADEQELVKFFIHSVQAHDYAAIGTIVLMGVFFAPAAEEFIFRGYLYGVLKRYTGMAPAILLNAAFFAAIHLNESSLAALFLLAVCFTLVYEFTGSILVNMCMHGIFNLINFGFLFYAALHQPA